MAKAREVLEMLIPTGGWTIYADDFDSIIYNEGVTPITKKQFDDGFAQVDAFKAEQEAKAEADKVAAQAKLAALGLTANDLKALGL
jgi:hypothetical protein